MDDIKSNTTTLENTDTRIHNPHPFDRMPPYVSSDRYLDWLNQVTDCGRCAVVRELDYQITTEVNRWKGDRRKLVEKAMRRVLARVLASPSAKSIVKK